MGQAAIKRPPKLESYSTTSYPSTSKLGCDTHAIQFLSHNLNPGHVSSPEALKAEVLTEAG